MSDKENPQQEFDEFDHLVDENPDQSSDGNFPTDDFGDGALEDIVEDAPQKKKGGSLGLVLALLILIGGAGAAVWFVFLSGNNAAPMPAPAPTPVVAELPAIPDTPPASLDANAQALPVTDGALPAGVTPSDTAAAPVPTDGIPPLPSDGIPPRTDAAAALPSPATPEAATDNATAAPIAEALPPPPVGTLDGAPAPVDAATDKPAETADAALTALPTDVKAEEKPADAAPIVADAPKEEPKAEEAKPVEPVVAAALPTDNAPAKEEPVTEQPKLEEPKVEAAALPAPVDAAPVATAPDAETASRLADAEKQIKDLSSALDAVKSAAPVASDAKADPALGGKIDDLNKKLDDLARQVDSLDQRTSNLAMEVQKGASSAPKATSEKVVVKPAPKKVAPKPVAKKKPAPAPAKKAANAVGGWELRSAQPGVAWLGKSGTGEIARFAVGQEVPGLGTVESVMPEGGAWVVRTTGGAIHQ